MKYLLLATAILLAFCSCTSNESNSTTDSTSEDSLPHKDSSSLNQHKSFLVIHGKDIWVREKPNDGQVVMKLNEGDTAELIATDPALTLIKGKADHWHLISFKGDTGWVFGSQTNLKLDPLGQGSTPEQAWADFTMKRRALCESFNESLKDDQYGGSSKVVFDSGGVFQMQYGYNEENFDTAFKFGLDTIGALWTLNVGTFYGAAIGCTESATVFGSHQNGWRMSTIVSGTVADHFQINDSLVLIALFYDKNCMTMGMQNAFIWAWSPIFNSLDMIQEIPLGEWDAVINDENNEQVPEDHVDGIAFRKDKGAVKLSISHTLSKAFEHNWNPKTSQFE